MKNTIKRILREETDPLVKFYNFVMDDLKKKTTFRQNNGGDVYAVDIGGIEEHFPFYIISDPKYHIDEIKMMGEKMVKKYGIPKEIIHHITTDYIFWLRERIKDEEGKVL